ncbi:MAG: gfo/Idh/MocA family oxidoreductase [Chloroflexi bacterium]|nr:MAG: gfo/Idh/MocA family oxidoreductase [Chloroflexota bacterium]
MLNVGLIGCGNVVSYGHKPALTALDDVNLVAVADVTKERRLICKEWFTLPDEALYADYKDMLARDDIDAVCVAVPQGFRREIVLDAFAAGKHVLSEKPIATSPAVATEMIEAAHSAGLVFGMVHNYLFLPEFIAIKNLIQSGAIGQPRVATLHFLGVIDYPGAAEYKSGWRHGLEAGGGVLADMIHAVYLAEWLFDTPATQVMAFVDALEYADEHPVIEDLALVQIAFPNGYAAIHMGWGKGVGGVDISGSDGHLRMRYHQYQSSGFNRPEELYTVDANWERHDHPIESLPAHAANIALSFAKLWTDFADAIATERPTVAPAESGLRALELVLGAYTSAVTGRVITLPLGKNTPVFSEGVQGLLHINPWPQSRTVAAKLFGIDEVRAHEH